jgi:hypothetical protein
VVSVEKIKQDLTTMTKPPLQQNRQNPRGAGRLLFPRRQADSKLAAMSTAKSSADIF